MLGNRHKHQNNSRYDNFKNSFWVENVNRRKEILEISAVCLYTSPPLLGVAS